MIQLNEKKLILYNGLLLLLVWMSGCKTSELTRQQLIYFRNVKDSALKVATAYEPVIQKGDILSIMASGSVLEKEAASPILEAINKSAAGTSNSSTGNGASSGLTGYLVSESGQIIVPFLGAIPVAGLTRTQAAEIVKVKLEKEIKDPVVELRFLNHKFTVLGEVKNPGPQAIVNDRVTIIDAIGSAGDLTLNGKRENIMIIRETDGKKEIGRINLNEGNIFSSPYYFIQPDDIVYVELNKFSIPEKQTKALQYIQLGLAVVTSISLLINLFKR
ncbi:MAG: polysaccharide biosynthesis/export family protein [Sphingobacteriales bacterium]|nr:polysaccharide biosynthesis/export family protein [Sphingobacteriales bacterium]MBI3718053.1 polysaccharide biosynthesis/export family protein [Sphingobacteriales bacterium]